MNVLFTGLGSIGVRHLENLTAIAKKRGIELSIDAWRSNLRVLPEEVKRLISREFIDENALAAHYDMAFITNPTHLHFDTLQFLRGRVDALFIEKPIFEHTHHTIAQCMQPNQKAYVAAPMRWCGVMLALKELLPSLRPYSARVICSSYLPEWRKGVDYRTVYSAHKEQGGGVTIDLIHEWDYIQELFGEPEKVYNIKGTYSELEIDSDDLSIYIAKYKTMLCEVHLDYFGMEYRRGIELFCKDGTVIADFGAGTLTLANGTVQKYEEPVNARYLREMDYFLTFALGTDADNDKDEEKQDVPSINTPQMALEVLKLTLGET